MQKWQILDLHQEFATFYKKSIPKVQKMAEQCK